MAFEVFPCIFALIVIYIETRCWIYWLSKELNQKVFFIEPKVVLDYVLGRIFGSVFYFFLNVFEGSFFFFKGSPESTTFDSRVHFY